MQDSRGNLISEEQEQAIYGALFNGNKIEAIKLHRQATGAGLKESKDFIDVLERQLRIESPEKFLSPEKKGCMSMIALTIGAGLIAAILR